MLECEELGHFTMLPGKNCGLHLSYYKGEASSCTIRFTASSSVNLVEEIHELLKIYFVIRFNPSYLDHCYSHYYCYVSIEDPIRGHVRLNFNHNVYHYLL